MSELTYEKIMDSYRRIMADAPPREPSLFDTLLTPHLMGMKVFERKMPPKIQVRDIKLSDGTSILSKEFRDETNDWLLARFGVREDPLGDKIFLIGGSAISMPPKHAAMIYNLGA